MSIVAIQGGATGTGTVTVVAPSTSTNRTLTLPDVTATVITDSAGILNIGTGQVYKDASGNVGIGTSSPKKKLTVSDASSASTTPGTNPVMWIGGGNVTVNTLSEIGFTYGANLWSESNVPATVGFQLTSTVGFGKGALTFCTRDVTTDTAPTERARIDSSGVFMLGTTTGSEYGAGRFRAVNTGGIAATFYGATAGSEAIGIQNAAASGTRYLVWFAGNAGGVGSITHNGSATSYNTTSDYRLKEAVTPMTGALAKVAALKPVTYKWKSDGSDSQGFIAHELQAVVPDCVVGEKDGFETYMDEDGVEQTRPKYQGIDTSFLVATLTAAIQELKALVDTQAARITALETA